MVVPVAFTFILIALSLETCWTNPLNGKHFRIAYRENPYAIYTDRNERNETVVRGIFPDMIKIIAARGNFTYTFVLLTPYRGFRSLPEEFKTREIDWFASNTPTEYPRNTLTDPLFPQFQGSYGLIIPYPRRQANIWSVVLPYTTTVWLCFLACTAVTSILLNIFARVKRHIHGYTYRDVFLTVEGSVLYVVGVASNQGASCSSKAHSVRLLAGLWCLTAFVIANAYSSSLITYMTTPKISPLINSIRDLDNKSEPQILTRGESAIRLAFESSPQFRFVRDNVLRLPGNFCGSISDFEVDHCLQLIKQGTHVGVYDVYISSLLIDADYKKNGRCELTLTDNFARLSSGWVMPLNSPHWLRNGIDVLAMEIASYGLLDHWDQLYAPFNDFCLHYKNVDRSLRKLSLKDFASAFIVLGIGVALSCFTFACEMLKVRAGDSSTELRRAAPRAVRPRATRTLRKEQPGLLGKTATVSGTDEE